MFDETSRYTTNSTNPPPSVGRDFFDTVYVNSEESTYPLLNSGGIKG